MLRSFDERGKVLVKDTKNFTKPLSPFTAVGDCPMIAKELSFFKNITKQVVISGQKHVTCPLHWLDLQLNAFVCLSIITELRSHSSSSPPHSAKQWRRWASLDFNRETYIGLFHWSQTRCPLDRLASLGVNQEGVWPQLAQRLSFRVMFGWCFWGWIPIWLTAK